MKENSFVHQKLLTAVAKCGCYRQFCYSFGEKLGQYSCVPESLLNQLAVSNPPPGFTTIQSFPPLSLVTHIEMAGEFPAIRAMDGDGSF